MSEAFHQAAIPVLAANGLAKSFKAPNGTTTQVIVSADFEVHSGKSISIRGESGCGKSTLLNLMSALETPTSGTVLWEGQPAFERNRAWRAAWRAENCGFVFQAYHLFAELNVLENVLLARRISGRVRDSDTTRAVELLDRVGLAERSNHLPQTLSGGERQRVAVARALLRRPRVLFADEPTGNLDEQTAERVMKLLLELASEEQAALVLVTHNQAFAGRCDTSFSLTKGHLQKLETGEKAKC